MPARAVAGGIAAFGAITRPTGVPAPTPAPGWPAPVFPRRLGPAGRIALGAAFGGGSLGLLGAALYGMLLGQANLARRAIEPLGEGRPPGTEYRYLPDGTRRELPPVVGEPAEGGPKPVVMALLGDSSMAGYGVHEIEETPGSMLATGIARLAERPVDVVSAAAVGACSVDLAAQVDLVLKHRPDVATILIGGNDVTHRIRTTVAVGHLERAVRRLVEAGVSVVLGTCPDLGTIRPIPQPLRYVARRWSRDLAAAQTMATVGAGGRTVSLGDLLGPEFAAYPAEMFSADRFHPSAAGYARAVSALLPSIAAVLDLSPEEFDLPRADRGEGMRTLPAAALAAAEAAGTEVAPAAGPGATGGGPPGQGPLLLGRWVELRHRIRLFGGWPAGGRAADGLVPDAEPVPDSTDGSFDPKTDGERQSDLAS